MKINYGNLSPQLEIAFTIIACLLFAGAYVQWPLFSSNQNSYFLKGLADAGFGYLSSDRLANQTDHIPVFSGLVSLIHRLGINWAFYLLHGCLASLYAWSLFAFVKHTNSVRSSFIAPAIAFAILTFFHASWMVDRLGDLVPGLGQLPSMFRSLTENSTSGMAGQYILGPYLQPSAFGVFLLASIAFFLNKREYLAAVCAVLAATMHPTYILHAAVLTTAYLLILVVEKRARKAVFVAVLTLALVLPTVTYVTTFFGATDSATLSNAQNILVEQRIPHHAKVLVWFNLAELFQSCLIVVGLLFARRRCGRLFFVLTFCFLVSVVLTIAQILSDNQGLALLFPWRTSAWIIPVATAVITGILTAKVIHWVTALKSERITRLVIRSAIAISIAFLVVAASLGVHRTVASAHAIRSYDAVASFVRSHSQPNQVYLVPVHLEWFRLETGTPIFVDNKTHPYRDNEVIDWYERMELTRAFYQSMDTLSIRIAFDRIRRKSPVTHVVVVRGETPNLREMDDFKLVYEGDKYLILRVEKTVEQSDSLGSHP